MPRIPSTELNFAPPRFRPWQSAAMGWAVAAIVLLAGVPLFLCMPPWVDVTLYDLAARNIIRGGVHYRDIFDTNLPGVVWIMAGVRLTLGSGCEVLRAFDLIVVTTEVWLIMGLVGRAGGSRVAAAWLAASVAVFYPFTSEFNHMQRDVWMLLPALAAVRLRLSRIDTPCSGGLLARGICEGMMWGAAVWLKPHVVVTAAAVWTVSAVFISRRESGRAMLTDLGALVLGGTMAGAAGLAWLIFTGAWPYFLDVFLNWNPGYLADLLPATADRLDYTFRCFRPWSLLHVPALLLAILAMWEARVWSRTPGEPRRVPGAPRFYSAAGAESVACGRAMLAALYLGWFVQAVLLQKGFDYVQVPLLLLAMGVVAAQGWAFGFVYLLWFAILGIMLNIPALARTAHELDPELPAIRLERHPLTDPAVIGLWPRCWREGGSPELRDRTGQYIDVHCGTNWEELGDVAGYLRSVKPALGPGELNCWHDGTHPLYLMLDLEPATRYMHYGTVLAIPSRDDWIQKQIAAEVAGSRQKYVVSDLMRMTWFRSQAYAPGPGGRPLELPHWFPESERIKFPWNQPIVFRSGRYLVHKVVNPPGVIDIPAWDHLDRLGPGR